MNAMNLFFESNAAVAEVFNHKKVFWLRNEGIEIKDSRQQTLERLNWVLYMSIRNSLVNKLKKIWEQ